ncbi:ATP-binding protein [Nonomuraea jiangxiensis]|uniref:ATPase family associated with various cellular activities (AAA) n=1 Tax=Nonomuraea jiangxiensis TaxID=633440 RepID=A0A1G9P8U0_9ACTN|nr:ATP-binding protein [Nonomuraea jiangxiensis]SDL95282.1 ATPase family associated with various cellular activities (AAA) [Nonomuraea jiangxiensis]
MTQEGEVLVAPAGGGMLDLLAVLDVRLAEAVAAAQASYGPESGRDPFRGLHIAAGDASRLLRRAPGESPIGPGSVGDVPGPAWLTERYGLSAFELNVLVVATAPEIDLRYERLYGYLQDDVTRRRPTVELTLNLLCQDVAEKLRRRAAFAADAPLLRHRLVRLVADPHQVEPPLLARYVVPDEQIADVLAGVSGLDRRLGAWCRLITAPEADAPGLDWRPERVAELRDLLAGGQRLYLRGPPGSGRRQVTGLAAARLGRPLLHGDLASAPADPAGLDEALRCFLREAELYGAVPYLDLADAPGPPGPGGHRWQVAVRALAAAPGPIVLAGTAPWAPAAVPLAVNAVDFAPLDAAERRSCWVAALAGRPVATADIDVLAERFPLTPRAIGEAAGAASGDTLAALTAAARSGAGHELGALAERIEPRAGWDDLVLPEDEIGALREVCARVAGQGRVLREWGFGRKLGRGTGVGVLLAGPPGTGKTMAAEVVAGELHLDLYRINLAGVVSKYIGETEKNLDRIFCAAERGVAILLFDEADALLGKRSEVRDAHDRYANIEVAYLLQRMEAYRGVTLLATNMRHNLDEAFTRRLAFTVRFPFPDAASRGRIWRGIWPAGTPLAADVDLDALAERFALSGGHIKNVALAAAFLADAGVVTMAHVVHAVRREYQKLGKALTEDELGRGDG